MQSVKLDKRLEAIGKMVRTDKRIVDVGTDHALLPCWLYQHGAREIYASDINEGPLESARMTMQQYGISGIELILSDGLKNVPPVDDVIIAGMGGELISDIISGCDFKNKDTHFILQPMTRAYELRKRLYLMGYRIERETTAEAGGKIYTVMMVTYCGESTEIDGRFAFCGENKDKIYIDKQISLLKKMGLGNPKLLEIAKELEHDG